MNYSDILKETVGSICGLWRSELEIKLAACKSDKEQADVLIREVFKRYFGELSRDGFAALRIGSEADELEKFSIELDERKKRKVMG